MEISERILLLLEENKITAYEVAKNLELSESTFSKWKKQPTSGISIEAIVKIADYFGVTCDYLIRGVDDVSEKTRQAMALLPYKDWISAFRSADKKSRNIVNTALDLPIEK